MKVGVLASRDQLCIHPDLAGENNATKTEMCKTKLKAKPGLIISTQLGPGTSTQMDSQQNTQQCECSYYKQYESLKLNGRFRELHFDDRILDVEDLRTSGLDYGYCPYYMSKTLVDDADIIFMPYNYLLDPMIRSFIGVELNGAVIILDEAHNVPQVCEDSASIEFKSSDITDAVEEVKKASIADSTHPIR